MKTLIGAALMLASTLLFFSVRPRGGKELRLVSVPGMWIALPLFIMLGFLSGGAMIYTFIGK